MNLIKLLSPLPFVAILAAASPALASATLTFEGQSNTVYNSPINLSGFTIGNVAGDEQHFHQVDSTLYGLASNGTGVLVNDRDSRIFIQDSLAALFTLATFDIASAFSNNAGTSFTVEGYLSNVLTGTVSGSLGQFASFSGAGLGNVDRLVFNGSGGGGGFELDNVTLNAAGGVPEPATWATMLVGFGGLGAMMRRRRCAALSA